MKESRGRLSYLTPDRTKPITARRLGDAFDRAAVLSTLEQNAAKATAQSVTKPQQSVSIMARLKGAKAPNVERVIDIEAKRAEGKGARYEHWASIHNLKNEAKAFVLYEQYGFNSGDELDAAIKTAHRDAQQIREKLKTKEASLKEKKELQKNLLSYIQTKPARDGLKAQKSEKARRTYREKYESEFIIAEAATRYFRDHGLDKLPNKDALQAEIEVLTMEANALYNEYREKSVREKELKIIRDNIEQTLYGAPSQRHEQSYDR